MHWKTDKVTQKHHRKKFQKDFPIFSVEYTHEYRRLYIISRHGLISDETGKAAHKKETHKSGKIFTETSRGLRNH